MELTKNDLDFCLNISDQIYFSNCKELLKNIKPFTVDEIEGVMGEKNDILYIVFRGSDDLKNWIDNFKFWKIRFKKVVPYNGTNEKIKVHYGFISDYKKVRDIILNHSKSFEKIIVVGHSLGGAISYLCALDIRFNQGSDLACVTFGSPEVGNKEFVKSFNSRIINSYRIVNGSDLVTKLPSRIFRYFHVGKLYQIGIKKYYFISIKDHHRKSYIESMKTLSI